MTFLENAAWRRAVKEFDKDKKVSKEDLDKILEAIRMAPSSNGLQPYHVYVVSDPEMRNKLKEKAYNQAQITDSTYLLVFCSRIDLLKRVEEYIAVVSGGDESTAKTLESFEEYLKSSAKKKLENDAKSWADRQTYLALGFGLAACAELKIDSCPMEGFEPEEFDKILKLPQDLKSVALLTVGYRKTDPKRGKVRFSREDLFSF